MRSSLALALLLLAADGVATLQWWALMPALAALGIEHKRAHPTG